MIASFRLLSRGFRLLAFVILVGTFSSSASGIIITSSVDTATQGAGVSAAGSWKGVGNITFKDIGGNGTDHETVDDQWCTGTVIDSPKGAKWVLTAAHCLYDGASAKIPAQDLGFNLPEAGISGVTYFGINTFHPAAYTSNGGATFADIALIELGVDLSGVTTAWDINRGEISDERAGVGGGIVAHKVGFGLSGDGTNGATGNPVDTPNEDDPNAQQGIKREGTNFVELFGPVTAANNIVDATLAPNANNVLTAAANTLIYDFDNRIIGGNGPLDPAYDPDGIGPLGNSALSGALAAQFSAPNFIVDASEADTAPGDSGGPMFMFDIPNNKWRVVGVTSKGTDFLANGSRFGDIAVDTRVQSYKAFIDATIPEPSSLILLMLGLFGVGFTRVR